MVLCKMTTDIFLTAVFILRSNAANVLLSVNLEEIAPSWIKCYPCNCRNHDVLKSPLTAGNLNQLESQMDFKLSWYRHTVDRRNAKLCMFTCLAHAIIKWNVIRSLRVIKMNMCFFFTLKKEWLNEHFSFLNIDFNCNCFRWCICYILTSFFAHDRKLNYSLFSKYWKRTAPTWIIKVTSFILKDKVSTHSIQESCFKSGTDKVARFYEAISHRANINIVS